MNDPAMVESITYEELKTLTLAYPYSHNLRYLLALKAQQVKHPEAAKQLATAAVFSLDNKQLFLLLAPKVVAPLALETVLELKPIDAVHQELEALVPRKNTVEALAIEAPTPKPAPRQVDTEIHPGFEITAKTPPTKLMTFNTWFSGFNPPVLSLGSPPRKLTTAPVKTGKILAPEPPTGAIAHVLAEKSVTENKELVSETLARLMVRQGLKDKAIEMYARLSLLNPEKSLFFAAEIEKLKK